MNKLSKQQKATLFGSVSPGKAEDHS